MVRDAFPYLLTGVKCRATSVAKKQALNVSEENVCINHPAPVVTPFHYTQQICFRGGKSRKGFSFDFVFSLWLTSLQNLLLKLFSFIKTP